jgi:serine/threonine-protein phosphatase PP1 catalytic subunit
MFSEARIKYIHKNVSSLAIKLIEPFSKQPYNKLFKNGEGGKSPLAQKVSISIEESSLIWLINNAIEVFMSQPMLLKIKSPMNVCADIHGQYADLYQIFTSIGFPSKTSYLFLGDYVDRGNRSIEVISLLFCYKILYPNSFFLLRGNHESEEISKNYGFYEECKNRYSVKLWKTFVNAFKHMPVCAIIGDRIICMHGGLSPHLKNLNDINNIIRPVEIPEKGLLADLLWSDPYDQGNFGWSPNDRGISYVFDECIISEFLKKNDLKFICRGHQVVEDGYEFYKNKRELVTLFSAPRYCGEFDNKGAILKIDKNYTCSFEIFD